MAARWLPQQLYVGLAPPSAAAQGEAAGGADQQQMLQQQQQRQQQAQPMRAEWRPQPQEPPAGTAAAQLADGQAAGQAPQDASSNGSGGCGQQAEAQPGADQQQLRKAEGGYDPMPAVTRLQLQVRNGVCLQVQAWRHGVGLPGFLLCSWGPPVLLMLPLCTLAAHLVCFCLSVLPQIEMELAFGWQPLRHGAAVPSLLAHWCAPGQLLRQDCMLGPSVGRPGRVVTWDDLMNLPPSEDLCLPLLHPSQVHVL